MLNFMKICPMGTELFHAYGRTDMTKLILVFRNIANASKNGSTRTQDEYFPSIKLINYFKIHKRSASEEKTVFGFRRKTGPFHCDKNTFKSEDFLLTSSNTNVALVINLALVKASFQPSLSVLRTSYSPILPMSERQIPALCVCVRLELKSTSSYWKGK
jgi:hypothetical protein